MNPTIKPKKPFGLTLSCKIAADALKQSVAPNSVILANLLLLQQETTFPKELDVHYFSYQKGIASDHNKKNITILLDELKKPQDIATTLEKFITPGWVIKKILPHKEEFKAPVKSNQHKPKKKYTPTKLEPVTPIVVVKKTKFNI